MIFTQETKDSLLLEFLIAYDMWCDTNINPEGFGMHTGLCGNIDLFQDNRDIRKFASDCGHAEWLSTNWLLWDHLNSYFDKDEDGDPECAPFGRSRDETSDFRENPKRRAWVKMMIDRLIDGQ